MLSRNNCHQDPIANPPATRCAFLHRLDTYLLWALPWGSQPPSAPPLPPARASSRMCASSCVGSARPSTTTTSCSSSSTTSTIFLLGTVPIASHGSIMHTVTLHSSLSNAATRQEEIQVGQESKEEGSKQQGRAQPSSNGLLLLSSSSPTRTPTHPRTPTQSAPRLSHQPTLHPSLLSFPLRARQ